MRRRLAPLMVAAALTLAWPAAALEPDEILADPVLETRARELSGELRCLICQNQSIDDSNAPLARDLRLLVRERLEAGDTNAEVKDYLVARYGEFVLLRPPLAWHTLLLWLAPVLFLLAIATAMWRRVRAPSITVLETGILSPGEEEKLARLSDRGNGV